MKTPALSENHFWRYFNFIALYLAQGIPEGMLAYGIPAWMAMNGKTPGQIGAFVAAVILPWSFKLLVAPLMDRFTYLPMGRRRPWVLLGQMGLVCAFIFLAFVPDPLNNLTTFMLAGFTVGCFGAFQDVATDGMAVDIVPEEQQAKANGFMWGAKILGTSASLAVGSYMLGHYDYRTAILVLALAVGIIMLVPLFLRERPGEKFLPWTKGGASVATQNMQLGNWKVIFKSLFSVFSLQTSLLVALLLFVSQFSFSIVSTSLPIFTVQALGWTDQLYAQFFATASLIGGFSGMIIGGMAIDKFGKKKMMGIYYLLLIVLTVSFVLLKSYWTSKWVIIGFMCFYQILFVFSSIGIFALAMRICWKKVSASQFTIFMTIGNLGRISGAKSIGELKAYIPWEYAFLLFCCIILLSGFLLRYVHIKRQIAEIEKLEQAFH